MMTMEKLKAKINKYPEPRLLVTVVELPTKALETIVNYHELKEKLNYILKAYDEDLTLKTCKDIKLIDLILL